MSGLRVVALETFRETVDRWLEGTRFVVDGEEYVDVSNAPLVADEEYLRAKAAGLDAPPPVWVDFSKVPLVPDREAERRLREARS